MKSVMFAMASLFALSLSQAALAQTEGCQKILESALKSKGLSMDDMEGERWLDDVQADDSNRTHYYLAKPKACSEGELVAGFSEGCTNMLKMFTRRGCELPGIKTRKTF